MRKQMVQTLRWATAHLSIRRRHAAWGRWAHGLSVPCARPGPTGCALGAPSLFLDSVLFLSHCLDTVHQIFSKKK